MVVGLIIVVFSLLIAVVWINGVDNMKKNHPDYKGEDFLDWDDNKMLALKKHILEMVRVP